jgi:hypothetical protein
MGEAVGVALRPFGDGGVAPATRPRGRIEEAFQPDLVAAFALEAAHQVDRAAEQPGQQPRPLRERGGMAEEIHRHPAPFVQRHAVAGHRQPLAALQPLREVEHQRGIELADLDQPHALLARLAEQAVEVFDVVRVHQHVQRHLFAQFGQCAANVEVAEVGAHQQLAAPAAAAGQQLRADAVGIEQAHLLQPQRAAPHVQPIQQAIGEGHELREHAARCGAQFGAPAPGGEACQVIVDAAPCGAAGEEEVQHDQVQQRRQQATAAAARHQRGETHQQQAAALALRGPVALCGELRLAHAFGSSTRRPEE